MTNFNEGWDDVSFEIEEKDYLNYVSVENHSLAVLDLVRSKVESGSISVEDMNSAYDIARKHEYGHLLKLSPRLLNRKAALESIDGLKAILSKPIAIGIIGVLIGIIVKFLLGESSDSGGGGGGGGGGSADKRIKELKNELEALKKGEKELEEAISNAGQNVSDLVSNTNLAEAMNGKNDSIVKWLQSEYDQTEEQAIKNAESIVNHFLKLAKRLGLPEELTKDQAKLLAEYTKNGKFEIKELMKDVNVLSANKFLTLGILSSDMKDSVDLSELYAPYHTSVDNLIDVYENRLKVINEKFSELKSIFDFDILKDVEARNTIKNLNSDDPKMRQFIDTYRKVISDIKSSLNVNPEELKTPEQQSKFVANFFGDISKDIAKIDEVREKLKVSYSTLPTDKIDFDRVNNNLSSDKVIVFLTENIAQYERVIEISKRLSKWFDDGKRKEEITTTLTELKGYASAINLIVSNSQRNADLNSPVANLSTNDRYLIEAVTRLENAWTSVSAQVMNITKFVDSAMKYDRKFISSYIDFVQNLPISINNISKAITGKSSNSSTENYNPFEKTNNTNINITVNNDITIDTDEFEIEGGIFHVPKSVILPEYVDKDALRHLVEEDPSNWSSEVLVEYVKDTQASLESLEMDIDIIMGIHDRLKSRGMVARQDIVELEKIRKGLITNQVPLGRFSSFESVTNLQISLENSAKLANGAKIIAAVAGAAIIGKIIHWCVIRFQASRDVTKAIKSRTDVIKQKNSEAIGALAGQNNQVENLNPDMRGQLKENFRKKIESEDSSIKLGPFDSFYNVADVEASLRKLRNLIFASKHEKTFSELHEGMFNKKGPYKVLEDLIDSTSDGAKLLDGAVDTVSTQILSVTKNQGNNTSLAFKPIEYKIAKNSSIKHPNAGNPALGEAVKAYIKDLESKLLGYQALSNMETDKFSSMFSEFSKQLSEVDGRAEKTFKKIEERLNKLEKENAKAAEKDNSDGSANSARDAIKSYLETIRAEFTAYSLLVGAQAGLLKMIDKELKTYESVIDKWTALCKWHAKEVSRLSKNKASEAPRDD